MNGDAGSEGHGANGIAKEDSPKENGDMTAPPSASIPDGNAHSPPVAKANDSTAEPLAPVSPPVEESKAEAPKEDIEMSEAQPEGQSPAAPAEAEKKMESADETMADTATEKPNPTPGDVAQEDVKTEVVVPASSSEENKASTAQPAEIPSSTDDAALPTSEVDLGPASISQLNIETEGDTSPVESNVQQSVEVSMTDAPAEVSTTKIAREREDDAVEEPAPKRARTEPKESEEKETPTQDGDAPTPAASAPPPPPADLPQPSEAALKHFEDFPQWNDPEFNARQIQPFQRRDLRKAMARVKKTKHGMNFRDAVVALWPGLKEPYLAKIQHPMDLGYIDKALRDGKYNTFGEVKLALALMYDNCITFNGVDHDMAKSAHNAVSLVWDDIMVIPATEPVKAKPTQKMSRPREPRNVLVKPEEAQAGSPAADAAPKAAPLPRRQSTLAEADRPKRTPRPTKPKEIEYGNSRSNLKPEMQFADEILTELTTKKNATPAIWFKEPVDPIAMNIPHYRSLIPNPMDFGTIAHRIHTSGDVNTLKEFERLMRLVFANAYKFNGKPQGTDPTVNPVAFAAKNLEDQFNTLIKNKDKWLARRSKAQAPPPSASAGSDEEDDEDDDDDGEVVFDASTQAREREVKDLDVRYREETQKLTDLFAAEAPNQSMIDVQQQVLNMVQKALLDAKLKLNEAKQKSGGGKAKKAKPAKKAAGGGGGRKSGGAAPAPKKATGGGGQKKKKNLSAADKDNIANAINDLEYPNLDKAIDIIKRDTGQMVSSPIQRCMSLTNHT